MIEVLETGNKLEKMVYVTTNEKSIVNRLFGLKAPAGFYYRNGSKIAYHWLLNTITVGKLNLTTK